ncbi:hypothetical protein HFN89_01495 [Rhizobium laguerreae]|nr:hypothetical protein [Rhizobium laguerreae]
MTDFPSAVRIMRMHMEAAAEGNPALLRLLDLSVGRVTAKAAKRPPESFSNDRPFRELDHIVDWLKAALVNDAPWLRNIDAEGRPKKLLKFGTLDAIRREADKDMLRRSRKVLRDDLPTGSEEIVATLEGGYTVVRLLTVEALDAESAEMRHCVGDGAYDDTLTDGETILLSLRDPNGRAHVTIEIVDNLVGQVQGKQNKPPKAKYISLIASFLRQTAYDWQRFGDGTEGFVIDVNGVVYSCGDLPDELHAHGALVLRSRAKMPSLVRAEGDVTLYCYGSEPPRRIVSGGDIHLGGPGFRTCPELELNGSLLIQHTLIERLPPGLAVNDLYVTCTPLRAVPDDLRCTGRLGLTVTEVRSLPIGLWNRDGGKVSSYGSVDLCSSPISNLGGLDTVRGSLCLNWTKMAGLPANFTVDADLSLKGLKDFKIGSGLSVDRLNAEDSDICFLGDTLAAGKIKIDGCGVKFPAEVLCSELLLSKTTIVKLPDNLDCTGRVYLHSCFSDGFPDRIRSKELWLYKTMTGEFATAMTELDGDIEVGTLAIGDGKLRLGDRLKAQLVAVFNRPTSFARMSVSVARDYLANHAPGALERFATDRGVEFTCLNHAAGALPGTAEEKRLSAGVRLWFGMPL